VSEKPLAKRHFRKFSETLNLRLPLKNSYDRPQTLPKRVSDYPQHFIFWRQNKFFVRFVWSRISFLLILVKIWPIIWGSYELTDVTINFLAIFCFRCTCDHLCTSQKRPETIYFSSSRSQILRLFILPSIRTDLAMYFLSYVLGLSLTRIGRYGYLARPITSVRTTIKNPG